MGSKYDDEDDETSSLLQTVPPNVSRSGSIVGIPSTILEPPNVYKSRWRSIRVMYLTMFLSSLSFSICMSSLWPYMQVLDPSTSAYFLGWVVAVYSLGQLVASPVFGWWANLRKKSREPLVVSMLINILANILYMYLESLPHQKTTGLLLARVFIGFGAGNVAVVRSYVSGATTIKERTSAMAAMSAFQSMGFILGPVLQTAMVPIGYPGAVHTSTLHLDMYTAPAFLSAICGVINILLLFLVFREHVVHDEVFVATVQSDHTSYEDIEIPDYKPDYIAVISAVILFFSVLFIFSVFETIGTPLTMDMYAWTKKDATLYTGIILACGGVISIVVFVIIKILSKRVNERVLLLGGFAFCLAGFCVYLPWGSQLPPLQYTALSTPQTNTLTPEMTTFEWPTTNLPDTPTVVPSILTDGTISTLMPDLSTFPPDTSSVSTLHPDVSSVTVFPETSTSEFYSSTTLDSTAATVSTAHSQSQAEELWDFAKLYTDSGTTSSNMSTTVEVANTTAEATGCPVRYTWCLHTPVIFLWQFLFGTALIAIGYPTCSVMTYTMFSKILGPKPQGVWMGWLTASGSLARTLGPVFVSQIYDAFGPRVTFITMCGFVFLTIVLLFAVFRRLVPFTFQEVDFNKNSK